MCRHCGAQGGQIGLDPTDHGQPLTYAYNLTIDQRLPWNSMLEVAYVGNQTSQLSDDAEDLEGSNYSELANQNKTPMGAFFSPDPLTGKQATNPENVTKNPKTLRASLSSLHRNRQHQRGLPSVWPCIPRHGRRDHDAEHRIRQLQRPAGIMDEDDGTVDV